MGSSTAPTPPNACENIQILAKYFIGVAQPAIETSAEVLSCLVVENLQLTHLQLPAGIIRCCQNSWHSRERN